MPWTPPRWTHGAPIMFFVRGHGYARRFGRGATAPCSLERAGAGGSPLGPAAVGHGRRIFGMSGGARGAARRCVRSGASCKSGAQSEFTAARWTFELAKSQSASRRAERSRGRRDLFPSGHGRARRFETLPVSSFRLLFACRRRNRRRAARCSRRGFLCVMPSPLQNAGCKSTQTPSSNSDRREAHGHPPETFWCTRMRVVG
ncbi:hypothetical protein M885DRAFT_297815 [Pelagophyceae sp. CCMP2097]|nr:hypothetical protein M885DRAFT_297815 [Pelagophyceae sp. CCMP2097]|mmetsp:Transcript_22306/g.76491  ORF Transcript_22306/g.76491 Transcript_22306/m.76491 type:complete len:202 (-) Transcript_22306:308-913(-)